VDTAGQTTSATYGDLESGATPHGPCVTVTTGTQALVVLTAQALASNGSTGSFMSVAVDGNNAGASDLNSYRIFNNDPVRASAVSLITPLTAGSHVFCAVYRSVGSGTSTFSARTIAVIP
jgi:hypothetical protein